MRFSRGFTLIELLVVVAIIAILAAIALPNLLEAQTRAKVSAAKSNLRTGATALQAFAVDNNRFPATGQSFPDDPLGLLASVQLNVLTTPVAYLSGTGALRDPFGTVRLRVAPPTRSSSAKQGGGNFPELRPPNGDRSLLYFHYPTLSRNLNEPGINYFGASLVSLGPDLRDSAGAWLVAPPDVFRSVFSDFPLMHPLDTVYDPTNGTVSEGDIPRFVGVAAPAGVLP